MSETDTTTDTDSSTDTDSHSDATTDGSVARRGVLAGLAGLGLLSTVERAEAAATTLEFGGNYTGDPGSNYGLRLDPSNARFGILGFSEASNGRGVVGRATSSSGTTIGVIGRSDSSSDGAAGLMGFNDASSGRTYGFKGRSDSTDGRGALGIATADSGNTIGLEGRADSPNGVALSGTNTAGSGTTYGVRGKVNSADGYGLYTPDDARIEGVLDTNETDFVVEAGTQSTGDARNVVQGHAVNAVRDGAVGTTIAGGGFDDGTLAIPNETFDHYGSIGGGQANRVGTEDGDPTTARFATVAGGSGNTASGSSATVGGGVINTAGALQSTVAGGQSNTASGGRSTVAGGRNNTASGPHATVSGGGQNTASGAHATVAGGQYNDTRARFATVAGGGPADTSNPGTTNNVVYDEYGTIGGGGNNQAGSDDGTPTVHTGATVGGGKNNTASGIDTTVGGGAGNTASGSEATVGGGTGNTATGEKATVGGGAENTASGFENATVGGGFDNDATDTRATVAGGTRNDATASSTTVGGGLDNTASGREATVAGGRANTASGEKATVCGGGVNTASGSRATVPGGIGGRAANDNSFVWNDGSDYHDFDGNGTLDGLSSAKDVAGSGVTGSQTFHVSAQGGFRFITGSSSVTYISGGSTGWAVTSSRAAKTDVEPVDPAAILDGVADLEISTWEYEGDDGEGQGERHIGPMAEDFHEVVDVGNSDDHINGINADGVLFAAVQGLTERLDVANRNLAEKADRIADLEAENEDLRDRNDELETRLEAVENHLGLDRTSGQPTAADD